VVGEGRREGAQGGETGQEVAEPEGAEHEEERPVYRS
jgi:hypothetical protein